MIDDIESLEVFYSLAETGSIQKTAAQLGIENSAASRKLSKLEHQIGRRLFDRSKRPFEMTVDGRRMLLPVRHILEERRTIEDYYHRLHDNESIEIRVMFGNGHINFAPGMILEYADRFPEQQFNMISPSDVNEFLAGKADVMSLSGQAVLADCVKIPRGRMVFIPVASPDYVKTHGMVDHPRELKNHRVFSNLYPNRFVLKANYLLTKNGQNLAFEARQNVRFTNVEMVHRAVIEGRGIAPCIPLFLCIDDLEQGRLTPVLNGWHRPSHRNYVAVKKDDWKIRQIRLFAGWWAQRLAAYEKECEARLVKLYGNEFLHNLLN